jgi:bifunctional DNase/RNase
VDAARLLASRPEPPRGRSIDRVVRPAAEGGLGHVGAPQDLANRRDVPFVGAVARTEHRALLRVEPEPIGPSGVEERQELQRLEGRARQHALFEAARATEHALLPDHDVAPTVPGLAHVPALELDQDRMGRPARGGLDRRLHEDSLTPFGGQREGRDYKRGMAQEVEVELVKVVIDERNDQQVIGLRERGGQRSFPIVIGTNEAFEIHRKITGLQAQRPLTHDLIGNLLSATDAAVQRVVISDLRGGTFYALLVLRREDGSEREVDSRPSDAIALSVQLGCPVFVAEHVFEELSHG